MELGTIFKIWDDGNYQLGIITEQHSHHSLIHYTILRTLKRGADYNPYSHQCISSKNNIVVNYGVIDIKEHQELCPEDWI